MSILLLTEVFPPRTGGSGRWFWELYRRLPGEEIIVVAGESPECEAFDKSHDLRIVRLPMTFETWGVMNPKGAAAYQRLATQIGRLAQARKVGAVHCGRCLPEGLVGFWLKVSRGLPYVCYAHGEELTYAEMSRELAWLMRRVYRNADAIIANSLNTLRMLQEGWGLVEDRLYLMNPGVDTGWFKPADRDPGVRDRLGWGDRPVVLTVGRLQERKGHDVMIRAFKEIVRDVPDALYAIVGDGECASSLLELVTSKGLEHHVRFHGSLDDYAMRECYQQCDLFVLPNRTVGRDIEGFGIVLLEAQACGKPVIAGASGGTAETMKIPETGLVVSCEEPGELTREVVELLKDRARRARMSKSAREWAVERFDWEVLSRRAEAMFRGESSDKIERSTVDSGVG
ncbi:glycosyltransferase family 4 protein [Tautonia rosea]|uniref:glycosyltransferase family 4 protein n=1 Tax=Tautonia rosea TaxID=2728037 RepID=UPI001475D336|nr:glycosyltransferase family 4 protein [Tautonia rosea]